MQGFVNLADNTNSMWQYLIVVMHLKCNEHLPMKVGIPVDKKVHI